MYQRGAWRPGGRGYGWARVAFWARSADKCWAMPGGPAASARRVRSTEGLEGDGGRSLAGGWLGWRRRWSEGGVTKGEETNGMRTAVTAKHRASGDCHPSGICCVTCAPSLAEAMRSRATGQTGCGQGGRRLKSTVRPSHTRSCRIASTVWGPTARGHLAGRSAHRDPH